MCAWDRAGTLTGFTLGNASQSAVITTTDSVIRDNTFIREPRAAITGFGHSTSPTIDSNVFWAHQCNQPG